MNVSVHERRCSSYDERALVIEFLSAFTAHLSHRDYRSLGRVLILLCKFSQDYCMFHRNFTGPLLISDYVSFHRDAPYATNHAPVLVAVGSSRTKPDDGAVDITSFSALRRRVILVTSFSSRRRHLVVVDIKVDLNVVSCVFSSSVTSSRRDAARKRGPT
jgi:hypothetical protein